MLTLKAVAAEPPVVSEENRRLAARNVEQSIAHYGRLHRTLNQEIRSHERRVKEIEESAETLTNLRALLKRRPKKK
jgi:hypothetical protein